MIKSSYEYDWINTSSNSLYFKININQDEVAKTRLLYEAYYEHLINGEDK